MSEDPIQIANVLDKAADHIDAVGWWQGGLYNTAYLSVTACPVCAIGAINMALHGDPRFLPGARLGEDPAHCVADWLRPRLGGLELAEWNDVEGRTQAEVTGLLREAAAELRGGEAA